MHIRVEKLALVVIGTLLATILAYQLYLVATYEGIAVFGGFDYRTYMTAASRWLAGGDFYERYQLAGPYEVVAHEIMYLPPILLLLVPFTKLPAPLWWAIPLAISGAMVVWQRPSRWGWVAILACLALPMPRGVSWALESIFNGNPGIWVAMAISLAVSWPAAGPWVLLKPTLAPFALVGVGRRSWWIGLAGLAGAAVFFAPMWPEYEAVVVNARTASSALLYSLSNVTLVLIPVVAFLSSTRRSHQGERGFAKRCLALLGVRGFGRAPEVTEPAAGALDDLG